MRISVYPCVNVIFDPNQDQGHREERSMFALLGLVGWQLVVDGRPSASDTCAKKELKMSGAD